MIAAPQPVPPLRRRLRWRLLGKRLLLAAASVLLMALLVEGVLRLSPQPPAPDESADGRFITFRHDREHGWLFAADARGDFRCGPYPTPVVANRWGIRNGPVDPAAPVLRVLVLGDSYAFGWGVAQDQALPAVLQDTLRALHPQIPLEVVNAAIPGYAPTQQVRLLRELSAAFPVDVVVSTFSLANDAVDELRVSRYLPDRLDEYTYDVRDPRSLVSRLVASSRLLTLLDERSQVLQLHAANASGRALGLARQALHDLADECAAIDAPLLLVVVPRASEIRPAGRGKDLINRLTVEKSRQMVHETASAIGVPLVDVKDVLLDLQRREPAYLAGDPHWSAAGHRVVVSAVARALPDAWLARAPRPRAAAAEAAAEGAAPTPASPASRPAR